METTSHSPKLASIIPLPEALCLISTVSAFVGLHWFNAAIASLATFWIYWRVREVVNTPTAKLIKRLGLEVPALPEAALLEVTSRSISLHWKTTDNRYSLLRYIVRINGQGVSDVSPSETAVTVDGLKPGSFYSIRIVAVNTSDFRASSNPINVRTKPLNCNQPQDDDPSSRSDLPSSITVSAYKPFQDSPGSAPPMIREPSGSHASSRRNTAHRKSSATSPPAEARIPASSAPPVSDNDVNNTISALTATLDSLRREIGEIEVGDEEDSKEFDREKTIQEEKLEALKVKLRERDAESKDLKKKVTHLERDLTTAQNKARNQERVLLQKRAEREKMHDDVKRWKQQMKDWVEQQAKSKELMEDLEQQASEKVEVLKKEAESHAEGLEQLETQVRERRIANKKLQTEKDAMAATDSPSDSPQNGGPLPSDQELEWRRHLTSLYERHNAAQASAQHAQIGYQQAQQRWDLLQARRGGQQASYGPHFNETIPSSAGESSAFAHKPQIPFQTSNIVGRISPHPFTNNSSPHQDTTTSQRSSSPWFMSNRNSRHFEPDEERQPTALEVQQLTGGALASPGATGLLPTGLLGDDFDYSANRVGSSQAARSSAFSPERAPTRQATGEGNVLPGLGDVRPLNTSFRNNSPTQNSGSPSPSLVSSPHGSIANLHQQKLSETSMDSDRRSIRSASSVRMQQPSRRFTGFFGSRARGKTSSEDGPELGSLSSKQTQSLPRAESDPIESNEPPPRKPGSSTGLFGQMSTSLLGRRHLASRQQTMSSENGENTDPASNTFSLFNPNPSIWSNAASIEPGNLSRPTSTYSAEQSRIGGPDLLGGWGAEGTSRSQSIRTPWSTHQSRRQSIQDNASSMNELDEDSVEIDESNSTQAAQAPIGTKPAKSKGKQSRPLNPNADSFMGKMRADKKSESKNKKKGKEIASLLDDALATPSEDASLTRKKSRGTHSIADSAETSSLRDGDDAETPSVEDLATPNSATRESFFRTLTRKGSSNRFSMQGLKFSRRPTANGHQAEDTDEEMSALGKSIDSITNTSQQSHEKDKRSSAFSLSSLKRRKKGNEAPSISETSMTSASATGDEDGSRRPSTDEQNHSIQA